jgi:hypothetical protein
MKIVICISTLVFLSSCVVFGFKLPQETKTQAEVTNIEYSAFPQSITSVLTSPKINLTITNRWKDSIEAVEIYPGQTHSGFSFTKKWTEKTVYKISFKPISQSPAVSEKRGTIFEIKTHTSETKELKSAQWRNAYASKATKVKLILSEITKVDRVLN